MAILSPSSLTGTLNACAILSTISDFWLKYLKAVLPQTASILLVPAATALSETIFVKRIFPVEEQCVPPQSSADILPNLTTLTFSSYFSPNNAIAPDFFAVSMFIISVFCLMS